jgi:two-component system response regulator HupR/HoxA
VTASNRDLWADVKGGRFRSDLFFRLNTFTIEVPALRERREDVVALSRYFVDFFNHQHRKGVMGLSVATERALLAAPWPGNVRELRNVIERAVLLCPTGALIEPAQLPLAYRAPNAELSTTLVSRLAETERETLRDALARHNGIVRRAALELGMNPVTFARRARKLNCLMSPSRLRST